MYTLPSWLDYRSNCVVDSTEKQTRRTPTWVAVYSYMPVFDETTKLRVKVNSAVKTTVQLQHLCENLLSGTNKTKRTDSHYYLSPYLSMSSATPLSCPSSRHVVFLVRPKRPSKLELNAAPISDRRWLFPRSFLWVFNKFSRTCPRDFQDKILIARTLPLHKYIQKDISIYTTHLPKTDISKVSD